MWSNFLGEYAEDLLGIVFMALFPYIFWILERLARLTAYGQTARIPRWLQWIPWADPHFRETVERGEVPSNRKWMLFILGIGLILPTNYLVFGTADPLGHRIVVVSASAALFLLAVALLEWLVRPKGSKGQ